jgi:hypothetical protein
VPENLFQWLNRVGIEKIETGREPAFYIPANA